MASVLCCIAGFVALLLLPVLAKSTYISENALVPGSANPMYGIRDAAEANKLVRNLLALQLMSGDASRTQSQIADWAILKYVTIAAASIGLCIISIINFATAQLGAILVVVICLIICPVKYILGKPLAKGCPLLALDLAVIITGFPPILLLIGRGLYVGFLDINFGYFWDWRESLWSWDSATYLYLAFLMLMIESRV